MHYTVLVIGESPEELLESYDESIEVEPYVSTPYKKVVEQMVKIQPELLDYANDPAQLRQQLINRNMYDERRLDDDCNVISTANPDGKWDWYDIGGRWADNEYGPTLADSRFERSASELEELSTFWDEYVINKNDDYGDLLMESPEAYRQKYGDKDTFLKARRYDLPYAILTPDGEWHEPGPMGWFSAMGSPESELDFELNAYERYIQPLDPDMPCCLVDCHI